MRTRIDVIHNEAGTWWWFAAWRYGDRGTRVIAMLERETEPTSMESMARLMDLAECNANATNDKVAAANVIKALKEE